MKSPKISILIPTRHHVKLLKKSIDSLVLNSKYPDRLEILLAIDEDDVESKSFIYYDHGLGVRVERCVTSRRDGVVPYYNNLINRFTGDVVMVWSDENIMHTRHWDKILHKQVGKKRWKIWMGRAFDYAEEKGNLRSRSGNPITGKPFACFPILSREVINILGYVMPVKFRVWGSDLYLDSLMTHVGRVIEMNKIEIETALVDKEARWKTYHEDVEAMLKEGTARKEGDKLVIDIKKDADMLKEAMKNDIPIPTFLEKMKKYIPTWEPFDGH